MTTKILVLFFLISLKALSNSEGETRFRVSTSLLSWQDTLQLVSASTNETQIHTSVLGICPGIGYEFGLSEVYALESQICLFMGSGNAGLGLDTVQPGFSYSARNIRSFGIHNTTTIWWRLSQGATSFGLSIPLLLNAQQWPLPNSDFQMQNQKVFGVGLCFSTRWQKETWSFTPKVGFYHSLNQIYWNIEVGKVL